MAYSYPAMVAWNPGTNTIVKNTVFQVYAPTDTTFTSPLAITDNQGNTLGNLNSGSQGVFPSFKQAQYATVVISDTPNHAYAWTVPCSQLNPVTPWAPNTYYTAGQPVVNPSGDTVTRTAAGTSAATYSADASNWTLSTTFAQSNGLGYILVAAPTGNQTTDTANIQNALNQSTSANPKRIILQAGTYQINAEIAFPFAPGTQLVGQGRLVTTIQQNTAGANIIAFRHDLTHSILIEGLTLMYPTSQTNAGSVGVFYDVAGGTSGGFYHHTYRDLWVTNCYDGFRLADNDSTQCLWDATWQHVDFNGLARSAVRLAPAGAIGMPELNFLACGIFCTPTVSGAQAFVFSACEVQMTGIAVEQWTDQAFYISGGGFLNIRNLHVESHNFNAATSILVSVNSNTPFTLDGFSISGKANSTNTANCILFDPQTANSLITIRNGSHIVTNNGSSAYVTEVVWTGSGVAGNRVEFSNIVKGGGFLNQPLTGSRGSQVAEYSPAQAPRQYRSVVANAPTTLAASAVGSGGTFAAGTYYYVVTNTIPQGTETVASNEVSVTLVANGSASLTWTNGSGATGVKVYRGTAAGAENTLVATLGVVTSYTDTNSGSAGTPPTTTTYNQQQFDGTIVAQGTSVTVKLLDPTTCVVGQPVTVKNTGANAVTVNSAGTSKTIDGAASTTLAQWAKGTYLSDGTQWLSI